MQIHIRAQITGYHLRDSWLAPNLHTFFRGLFNIYRVLHFTHSQLTFGDDQRGLGEKKSTHGTREKMKGVNNNVLALAHAWTCLINFKRGRKLDIQKGCGGGRISFMMWKKKVINQYKIRRGLTWRPWNLGGWNWPATRPSQFKL